MSVISEGKLTFKESVISFLENGGMFEDQAQSVFEKLKNDVSQEPMSGRWDERVDNYPQSVLILVIMSAKEMAVEWIDDNLPNAWYRSMFAD